METRLHLKAVGYAWPWAGSAVVHLKVDGPGTVEVQLEVDGAWNHWAVHAQEIDVFAG